MFEKVYVQIWITLDKETREHLSKVFSIPTSGIAEIRDQTLVSDGKTNIDLQSITKEAMEAYVGSASDFTRLWELTLAKCRYELHPPVGEIKIPEGSEIKGDELEVNNPQEEDVKTKKEKPIKKRTDVANGATEKSSSN